jgi:hypothetical protein
MTNERIPNDPYDPPRSGLTDDNFGRPQRFDNELQVDPELQEGPASSSKIALFAVGLALILGAVFYGLNNTSIKEAQTPPPAQTAQTQNANPPAAPPGMRHDHRFCGQPPDAAAGRAAGHGCGQVETING